MEKGQLWLMIGVALVVAVVASIITANITGNVITLNQDKWGKYQAYTKAEVDALTKNLGKGCQYVHYKDALPNGNGSMAGKTVWDACAYYGLTAKITTRYEAYNLYNYQNCSPSYNIMTANSHLLGRAGSGDILGADPITTCNNAKFPDGRSNGNFSHDNWWFYDGVICC